MKVVLFVCEGCFVYLFVCLFVGCQPRVLRFFVRGRFVWVVVLFVCLLVS